MKIGVYGGTFNPIHNGHLNILKGFKENLGLDKIIVIPTAKPPHKESPDLASSSHRMDMCNIALKDLNYCTVSDIEVKRTGKSYTIDTLMELKKTYVNDEIFLLMGEDMFMIIEKWRSFDKIFDLAKICVAPRSINGKITLENFAEKVKQKNPNLNYLITNIEYVEVSSTQIRQGKKELLPKGIERYIIENNIYWSGKN